MPYPIIVNLQGKFCVVVGAGRVAERRTLALLAEGARVRVVAPQASPRLAELAREDKIAWERGAYSRSLLKGAILAIAATDNPQVNEAVARDGAEIGVLVCRADAGAGGSFITPATIRRGDLLIAVSTGGSSPTLAAVLKERLEKEYGADWAAWARLFGRLRKVIQAIGSEAERRKAVTQILECPGVATPLSQGDWKSAEAEASNCISSL